MNNVFTNFKKIIFLYDFNKIRKYGIMAKIVNVYKKIFE